MSRREQNASPRAAARGKRRRPIEDRIAVRFQGPAARVNAWLTKLTLSMPRRWRLRRWLIEFSVWRAYNALARGDLAVLRTINHRDVIYDLSGWGWPEASFYRGRDGVVHFNELWLAQWSEPEFDVASIEELDDGLFLIQVRLGGIGHASGVEVGMDNFQLVRIRDGLIWRNSFFRDRAEAVQAVRGEANLLASASG
jgi:ketosteroid isomerase-like protein